MSQDVLAEPTNTTVSRNLKSLPTDIHFWRGTNIVLFQLLVFEYLVEDVYC
jgi:hypothetical protein